MVIFGIIGFFALLVTVFIIRPIKSKKRDQKQQKTQREYMRASKTGITIDEIMNREDY
ncbi:MAG: hypothetical protein MUP85_19615 [Candidatus Lokiarchaeota archaeon]|nr:hypothetical protein [Candidatus Lokiarchaeota archaeon]